MCLALRRGDNVTYEALLRCVYCWLKTDTNYPCVSALKYGCNTNFWTVPGTRIQTSAIVFLLLYAFWVYIFMFIDGMTNVSMCKQAINASLPPHHHNHFYPALSRGLQKLYDTHNCSSARKSLVKGERFSRSNAEEPEMGFCIAVSVSSIPYTYRDRACARVHPMSPPPRCGKKNLGDMK